MLRRLEEPLPAGDVPLTSPAVVDRRTSAEIGRRARLELRFGVRAGRTSLIHAYAEPPFRVGRPFPEDDGLHLILASSAPGVFGGDVFEQDIVVEPGARVRLTSQSALQVHPSGAGATAVQTHRFSVGGGASLVCEWEPIIPFPGSSLRQRLSVDLQAGARLFWSDAMMAGREARGERWAFARLDHELALRCAGALSYLERYLIEPARRVVDDRWLAADAAYFGSVLSVGGPDADQETTHAAITNLDGVVGAVDRLERGIVLARLMARSGTSFRAARAALGKAWQERER